MNKSLACRAQNVVRKGDDGNTMINKCIILKAIKTNDVQRIRGGDWVV